MDNKAPFDHLGFDRGEYFYLCHRSGQVLALRAEQHTEQRLIGLASRQYWEITYPTRSGADWRAIQNALIQRSYDVGIYDPGRLRGRGAWWETDHAIVHAGDRLIVNGQPRPLSSSTRFIYEASLPYPIRPEHPLDCKSAYNLIKICTLVSWDKPISAYYLAGWVSLATVGGALGWRPHVWLTASAESGKSTIIRDIVKRILAGIAIANQSCTTEAAIRGQLGSGSLPVILDEMESKTNIQKIRVDSIIDLARAASTEGGDPISKARPDGSTREVRVRSMFLFSSISFPLNKPEDIRRITPLAIVKDGNRERFEALKAMMTETLTDEFCARFCARSIAMIPVIRQSARVFSSIISQKFKSQGLGDQYGALIAGSWSLFSDTAPSVQQATDWIEKRHSEGAWTEQQAQQEETDEHNLYDHLMATVLRFQTKAGMMERSVANLLAIAAGRTEEYLSADIAIEVLALRGMRGDREAMVISTTHPAIAELLKDTAWGRNWGRTLKRLPGSAITPGPTKFGYTRSRAILLPWPDDDAPKKQGEMLPDLAESK